MDLIGWMVEDPLTLVLVCGGLGLIALGALLLAVERLTRPNPGYSRRHDAGAQKARDAWAEELGYAEPADAGPPSWSTPSGSWRMPGRASHRATGGPASDTRSLHPGYYAAGRATVFQRPPRDPEE